MEGLDRFLADVAARLPLPDDQRAEVLEELAAHLSDSMADLAGQGLDPDAAEDEALRRLGSPDDLARALLGARRTRRQLLAAAGAGTWAALRSGVLGSLAGWVLVSFAAIVLSVAVQALCGVLGTNAFVSWTPGWNSVIAGVGLAIGAFFAGAAAVRAVSARAWRLPREVRLVVAAAGMLVIGYVVLVRFEQSLNWASVVAFGLVPLAFVAGARFEHLRPPSARLLFATLVAALVLLAGGAVLSVAMAGSGATSYSWSSQTHGYAMIAPWWQDPASGAASDFPSSDYSGSAPGVETMSVEAASPAVIAEFRDFRLEAWKADAPGDGWQLTPGQTGPFATAPASVDGITISGTIRFNQAPGVDWAQVVLTAVGPDGHRYLLTAFGPEQTQFYGSVWAWFAALMR